jgi:hypothetical protein
MEDTITLRASEVCLLAAAVEKEHEITIALMNEIALLKAQLAETQRLVEILTENAHAIIDRAMISPTEKEGNIE